MSVFRALLHCLVDSPMACKKTSKENFRPGILLAIRIFFNLENIALKTVLRNVNEAREGKKEAEVRSAGEEKFSH